MFYRGRLVLGLVLSAAGIILARANDLLLGRDASYLTASYFIGVVLGLAGLVVVASSMKKSYKTMVQCPECFALNPVGSVRCTRCRRDLPVQDRGGIVQKA